jgi:hypothetical protein
MKGVEGEGLLQMVGFQNVDLSLLGIGMPVSAISQVRTIDLTASDVRSLAGLPFFERLLTFIADGTDLEEYTNFRILRAVTMFSVQDTPLSRLAGHFHNCAVLLPQCVNCDGKELVPVRRELESISEAERSIIAAFLDHGAPEVAEHPWPVFEELCELVEVYGLDDLDDSLVTDGRLTAPEFSMSEYSDFDAFVREFNRVHEETIERAEARVSATARSVKACHALSRG